MLTYTSSLKVYKIFKKWESTLDTFSLNILNINNDY